MKVQVSKMERPMPTADIGRPLRWEVNGPDGEVQRFHKRSDARLYAHIRAVTKTSNEAHRMYSNA